MRVLQSGLEALDAVHNALPCIPGAMDGVTDGASSKNFVHNVSNSSFDLIQVVMRG